MSIFSSNRTIGNYNAIFGQGIPCPKNEVCDFKRRNLDTDIMECKAQGTDRCTLISDVK